MTMPRCKLLVLTRAVAGQDDEFNRWYTDQHLADVLAVPGFVAASRMRQCAAPVSPVAYPYAAIYEIDHEDPQSVIDEMMSRVGSDRMPLSPALDPDMYCVLYEPFVEMTAGEPRLSSVSGE